MEEVVIYGAGNTGRSAYFYLKNHDKYECIFFIDSDENKWGGTLEGLPIKPPCELRKLNDVRIMIASIFWKEILESIKEIEGLKISIYRSRIEDFFAEDVNDLNMRKGGSNLDDIERELSERTIDLGVFLMSQKEIVCKELTFMPGGSGVLDYAFLKVLVKKYNCKTYLEIGTYIGESINILTDCCDRLYSVTAPMQAVYSMDSWCEYLNLPNHSEKLAYSEKITHFYGDSKLFDFSQIDDEIDLYFIDGDHSYNGVYADTKNIFESKKENAIVVWHDFRGESLQYDNELIRGVKDALGDKFKNVYVTNGNCCGIYLPDVYIKDFKMKELKYEKDTKLYTYDVILKNGKVK